MLLPSVWADFHQYRDVLSAVPHLKVNNNRPSHGSVPGSIQTPLPPEVGFILIQDTGGTHPPFN